MLNTLKKLNDNAREMLDQETKKGLEKKIEMLAAAAELKKQIAALERKYGQEVTEWALDFDSKDIRDEAKDTRTALKHKDEWNDLAEDEQENLMHIANNS